jgi:hypothetical protein
LVRSETKQNTITLFVCFHFKRKIGSKKKRKEADFDWRNLLATLQSAKHKKDWVHKSPNPQSATFAEGPQI